MLMSMSLCSNNNRTISVWPLSVAKIKNVLLNVFMKSHKTKINLKFDLKKVDLNIVKIFLDSKCF